MQPAMRLLCLLVASGDVAVDGWRLGWGSGSASGGRAGAPPRAEAAAPQPDHPAVTNHWCGKLIANGVGCAAIGEFCLQACAQQKAEHVRTDADYSGKTLLDPAQVVATAGAGSAGRRARCSAPLAEKHGVDLLSVHGEDIYAAFRNGAGGPAQRDVAVDISGWGKSPPVPL